MSQARRIKRNRRKKMSNKRRKQLEEVDKTLKALNSAKMVAMLVLRNGGWGAKRLLRFSENFDEVMLDVSHGYLSVNDIPPVLEEETGIKVQEIIL